MVEAIHYAAQHEAAHARVAQFFRLRIQRIQIHRHGDGEFVLHAPDTIDADYLFRRAVTAAVGPEFDRWNGKPADHHAEDLEVVRLCQERYAELHGEAMPCPYAAARKLLDGGFVYGDKFDALVKALMRCEPLTGADIDALSGVVPLFDRVEKEMFILA